MITLGIDLAGRPENTATCKLRWRPGAAEMLGSEQPVDDERLRELATGVDKVGVDVPLGWPRAFSAAVAAHAAGRSWVAAETKRLTHRFTDHFVHEQTGRWPLSVSTDRIGVPALRAARLFGAADRSSAGGLVEVYPAAALRCWDLPSRGYKGVSGRSILDRLVTAMGRQAWLDIHPDDFATDHAFDALICALVARAAALGLCLPPPPEQRDVVAEEGWIALPVEGSLGRLAVH